MDSFVQAALKCVCAEGGAEAILLAPEQAWCLEPGKGQLLWFRDWSWWGISPGVALYVGKLSPPALTWHSLGTPGCWAQLWLLLPA